MNGFKTETMKKHYKANRTLRIRIGFCKNRPGIYAGSKQIPLFFGNGLATLCANYKRCTAELNWLLGACSYADRFKRSCIARQCDMSMK